MAKEALTSLPSVRLERRDSSVRSGVGVAHSAQYWTEQRRKLELRRRQPLVGRSRDAPASGPPSPTGRGGKRPSERTRSYMTTAPAIARFTQKLVGMRTT